MNAAPGFRDRARRFARTALAALVLAAAAGGCGDDAPAPLAPPAPGPGVVEVFPAGRTTRVPFDVEAWVRFDAPLDSTTVNDRTVFFKLDTRRFPAEVRWESATNRVLVRPLEEPVAGRTHTVVLSTGVRGADGVPLPRPFEWQFRVIGVRLPSPSYPAPGATYESPFASAEWTPTETTAGDIVYEFYVGGDSATVAARALPPARVTRLDAYLPDTPWPLGSRRWWAVTAENRTLAERVDGPVSAFEVLPPGTPTDSSGAAITQYGYRSSTGAGGCAVAQLLCGGGNVAGARWPSASITGRRLAAARIETNTSDTNAVVALRAPDRAFNECQLQYPGPPFPHPLLPVLATSTRARGTRRLVFNSTLLTAHIERVLRRREFAGYLFESGRATELAFAFGGSAPPLIRVSHYVVPAAGPAPAAAPPAARTPAHPIERRRPTLDPSVTAGRATGAVPGR